MENEKIFDLLTKMYAEMQDIKSDMSEVKSNVNTLNSDMSEVKFNVNTLNSDMSEVKSNISELRSNMTIGFNNVNNKIDNLCSDIGKLVTNDIAHAISNQITELKNDVKFLTHKTNDTEKDVYILQDYIKRIK